MKERFILPSIAGASQETSEPLAGENLNFTVIAEGNNPLLGRIHQILVDTFSSEKVDTEEALRSYIDGIHPRTGEPVVRDFAVAISTQDDLILGTSVGTVLEMRDKNLGQVGSSGLGFVSYIAVPEEFRRRGVGTRVYSLHQGAVNLEARRNGLEIVGYLGEVEETAEEFFNAQGWRRLYFSDEGNFIEVPYYQPPLDWNRVSGRPAIGAGSAPEHLMLNLTDGANTISADNLMNIIRSLFNRYFMWPAKAFKPETRAYAQHTRIIQAILREFEKIVDGRELVMLSKSEREEMKKAGTVFVEHKA